MNEKYHQISETIAGIVYMLILALILSAVMAVVLPDFVQPYDWTEDEQYLDGECREEIGDQWRAVETTSDQMLTCTNGTVNRTVEPHDKELVPANLRRIS